MLFEIQNKLVNWADGMKMSRNHLVQTENYLIDSIRDSINIQLNTYNYGLLSPLRGTQSSCDFSIMEKASGEIEVEVRHCNAITAGGSRICFHPADPTGYLRTCLVKENEEPATAGIPRVWDIVFSVNLFGRTPTGIPDMEETPPRLPDAFPVYSVAVWPAAQVANEAFGMNNLVIGRISAQDGIYTVDESYIPASACMLSHPNLTQYYETFAGYIHSVQKSARIIGEKVRERENTGIIGINTNRLCEDIQRYIAPVYFGFRNQGPWYTPIQITGILASLAHTCFVSINSLPAREREEMLKYFHEWCDIAPGNFMILLGEMLEHIYQHTHIQASMETAGNFLALLAGLLHKLSNLEYIGQHKENIVVAEKIHYTPETPKKGNWSILD